MSEGQAIDRTVAPVTVAVIRDGLNQIGLPGGASVLVHSSLSALGWVPGGPHAVVLALLDAVGPAGTVVMPTHSGHLSDPAQWSNPPVPETWWDSIRRETPAYDPLLTPTRYMGAIVECFRHVRGVSRSDHPTCSFAAVGPATDVVVGRHDLADALGEGSPLARLYDLDAWVLLLGVSHANNTSLHLAEYRAAYPRKPRVQEGSPVVVDGRRQWVNYTDVDGDSSDFEALGDAFVQTGHEARVRLERQQSG